MHAQPNTPALHGAGFAPRFPSVVPVSVPFLPKYFCKDFRILGCGLRTSNLHTQSCPKPPRPGWHGLSHLVCCTHKRTQRKRTDTQHTRRDTQANAWNACPIFPFLVCCLFWNDQGRAQDAKKMQNASRSRGSRRGNLAKTAQPPVLKWL